jgi:hypothetical protein
MPLHSTSARLHLRRKPHYVTHMLTLWRIKDNQPFKPIRGLLHVGWFIPAYACFDFNKNYVWFYILIVLLQFTFKKSGRYVRGFVLREFEIPLPYDIVIIVTIKSIGKAIPLPAYGAQRALGRLRLPDSVTSALEGGRLSAIRTGRLYLQEYPSTHFKRLSRPRAHGIVGCHGKNPQ